MDFTTRELTIEVMTERHGAGVMEIFNHYVETGFSAYFETPLPVEFFHRILEMTEGYPAFVAKAGEVVAGFAFLHAIHPAPALSRIAEVSYFIHPAHTRKGLGKLLLERMIERAEALCIDSIVASVSSQNLESLEFHRKNGFREAGRLENAGRKFGRDFDVVFMQRKI